VLLPATFAKNAYEQKLYYSNTYEMRNEFKNKTVYIRESYNEEHPYTIISNYLVKDNRLTATEKGLMLMILSNKNIYVLNSSYLQKESGLGKVQFNKSMKKLQQLGYLLKKPVKNGGYKWIVMESTIIFEDVQKIGYLTHDPDKSNWIINEALESTLQLTDFHRKSENRNPENRKPENGNPINGNPENRNPESQPIISTNDTNTNIGINNKKENTNGENTNATPEEEILILGSSPDLKIANDELKSHTPNSFPVLLEHSESLKNILKGDSLTIDDFQNYSDSYIAHIVLSCNLQSINTDWKESYKNLNYNRKHYGGLTYACRSALELNIETDLKKEMLYQSKLPEKELYRLLFGHYKE
jgi:hypothetical protein